MGLRCDIWLNDEWSSNILFGFFPSIITTCLEIVIIAKLYSPTGIKCFTCHLSPHCKDINPMDLENSWPDSVHWVKIFIIGTCIKLLDVFVIAIVSLKFMVDFNQPAWITTTKFLMWLIVFPWIVITPVIGVIRWVLVPSLESKLISISGTPWLVAFVVGIVMTIASFIKSLKNDRLFIMVLGNPINKCAFSSCPLISCHSFHVYYYVHILTCTCKISKNFSYARTQIILVHDIIFHSICKIYTSKI